MGVFKKIVLNGDLLLNLERLNRDSTVFESKMIVFYYKDA